MRSRTHESFPVGRATTKKKIRRRVKTALHYLFALPRSTAMHVRADQKPSNAIWSFFEIAGALPSVDSGYLSNIEVSSIVFTFGMKGGVSPRLSTTSQSTFLYHLCFLMSSAPALRHPYLFVLS